MLRAYNRFMGRKCRVNSKRLKWAGLVPLREPRESIAALEEMIDLGSSAVVVFGTARDKMLSDPSFTPFWDDFARTKLPLCVHMAASYPPFDDMVQTFLDAHALSMALPAQMALWLWWAKECWTAILISELGLWNSAPSGSSIWSGEWITIWRGIE